MRKQKPTTNRRKLKSSKAPEKALSWKPVKRGKLYCSPACGGGCTRAAFRAACDAAEACCLKMDRVDLWEIHVWENLGWHWRIERKLDGGMLLTVDGDAGGYHAMLGENGSCWSEWYDQAYSKTPQAAVDHRMNKAAAHVKRLNKMMRSYRGIVLKSR